MRIRLCALTFLHFIFIKVLFYPKVILPERTGSYKNVSEKIGTRTSVKVLFFVDFFATGCIANSDPDP
jgi:hypothetical protein